MLTEKDCSFSFKDNLNFSNEKKKFDPKNELPNAFECFSLKHESNSSSVSSTTSEHIISNNSEEIVKSHLISFGLNPKLVDDVLKKYKGETDIEKLIFLAHGILFSSDF